MADWTSESNDVLKLALVRAPEDEELLNEEEDYEFRPTFTYPIYGEDEKIYGYNDLLIDLRFASGSLIQYLNISYSSKIESSTAVADDVEGTLANFIPPDYFKDEAAFLRQVDEDATTFQPMGRKIASYTRPSGKGKSKQKVGTVDSADEDAIEYEVYYATWDTPGFKEYHRRMQIFILFYIEAGSYIQEDEDSWEFVILFEKRKRRDESRTPVYHFVGYSTLYPFYCFPEKVRMRISQFVILPPYQRSGHGSALYNAIYAYILSEDRISELTVEDPAEAFEDLRDRNDLKMLLNLKDFYTEGYGVGYPETQEKIKGKLRPPAEKGWVEAWRRKLKIAGRQFNRLIEMLILKELKPSDVGTMRAFRLQVKERLYRFNFETLAQLEKPERLEKLEETFQNVKTDYQRILGML